MVAGSHSPLHRGMADRDVGDRYLARPSASRRPGLGTNTPRSMRLLSRHHHHPFTAAGLYYRRTASMGAGHRR